MNALSRLVLVSFCALPLLAQEPGKQPASKPADASAPAAKTLALGARLDGATTLSDIDGKPVKAKEHMGKITVVNFFSIECPIQRAWDNRIAEIQKEYEAQGVIFLHVDSNTTEIDAGKNRDGTEATKEQRLATIRDYLKKKNLPFRVLVDQDNKVADLFDAKTTPHIYVFGKDGRLAYKGLVDDDKTGKAIKNNYLSDVLGKLTKDEKVEPFSNKEEGCSIKRVKAVKPAAPVAAPAEPKSEPKK